MRFFFSTPVKDFAAPSGVPSMARSLAAHQLHLWSDPALRGEAVAAMRRSNAEWDFMGRTFLVAALANMALREPASRAEVLRVMDLIIDETVRLEEEKGMYHFLMAYARAGEFVVSPARSQFIDGEIAFMMAHRLAVQKNPVYEAGLEERVAVMKERMELSPVLSAESYPDECWTFCNTVSLASMAMADALLGTDHSDFLSRWVAAAEKRLVHEPTGLLVSSYTQEGEPMDGPEGSSIWMSAHCLGFVDPAFARDQYDRAKKELEGSMLGFGYAREWPDSWQGPQDIDSGPVIPFLGISPGASGLALLGAATFGDGAYLAALLRSLNFAAFASRDEGRLKYNASNSVGDAVMLYAALQGPVQKKITEGSGR